MTIYYLMIKTHNKTGLKYLCQTKRKNPHTYPGSGIDWGNHLAEHGKDIHTEIIYTTSDWELLKKSGRYHSIRLNVVGAMDNFGNKIWANRIPETGGGGGHGMPWVTSRAMQRMVKNGTHPFLGGEMQYRKQKELVNNGTHHWLSGDNSRTNNNRRLADKSHNFLDSENQQKYIEKTMKSGHHACQIITSCVACQRSIKGLSNLSRHFKVCCPSEHSEVK